MEVCNWVVTGWALIQSKVDWKQTLHYNHALGTQDGPLISGRLPNVAQPHCLTYVGTGHSLLGLRNKFSPSTEVGLLTWFGDARSGAVFLEGNQDWSPLPFVLGTLRRPQILFTVGAGLPPVYAKSCPQIVSSV